MQYNKLKSINLILACTFEGGIGQNNKIPWYISDDLKKFKYITSKSSENKYNAVIMGRKTYESLPNILKNRYNIIISNTIKYKDNDKYLISFNDINDSLEYCYNNDNIDKIFIIGGSSLYNYFLSNIHLIDVIYLSIVNYQHTYKCDISIDIIKIFKYFNIVKDSNYIKNNNYSSFLCYPKSSN